MKPEKVREMNEEVKQLLQLAKSMHFVTEVKKKHFCLVDEFTRLHLSHKKIALIKNKTS